MIFESPAEEAAYPIIESFCKTYGFAFEYQHPIMDEDDFDYRDWVYDKYGGELPEWLEKIHDKEHEDGNCRFCCGGVEYEKYRIDFVIKANGKEYAVEIDGKEFHTDKEKESERDFELQQLGFIMLHIPATVPLYKPGKFNYLLRREITGYRVFIDGFGELYGC